MSYITILDGGMGRQLESMGAPFKQPEWSALALMEAPETVTQAHQAFIDAGCDVITTNAYALVPFHIGQDKFDSDGTALISLATNIARTVADETKDRAIKVVGSLPPAFGSYQPELFKTEKADEIYAPLIDQQKDHIDFWLAETMSSVIEAKTIAALTKNTDKDLWLSYSLKDRYGADDPVQLRSGEDLKTAVQAALDMGVSALLFNCSQPEELTAAFEIIQSMNINIPFGGYANSFDKKESKGANEGLSPTRKDITPQKYLEHAAKWKELGATIIGGCCGIGPDHIKELTLLNKE